MVAVLPWLALAVLVGLHALVAALAVRWLRVRLTSRWAPPLFALVFVPVVLVASTLVFSGGLGVGPDLGDAGLALFLLVALPLGLGLAVDYLWMPHPDDVTLPAPDDR